MRITHWTATWLDEVKADRGRQWIYAGSAREAAEAKGYRLVEVQAEDMVLSQAQCGKLVAIGTLAREDEMWAVDIPAA